MGNHPSAHQPLERAAVNSNPLRLSKRDKSPVKRMDRLRRSFRDSFRRRKESHIPESSKPHQWQADESAVRSATCAFHVKYLGCVEVFESRGMQVCEEAIKVLRNSRRRPVRAILHVSGDGLRVVEDETKGLIVDQTIEKVSFCAPDRNHEKGFSYICRDGTTRRWMCHGFLALKESGERLSHAVGCAFAACLERKQRRDKECAVTMTFDSKTSTFTRSGSFRQPSLTEKLEESQERAVDVPLAKPIYNPFAIERPHATPSMLERQGSFRGFNQLNQASPFKRQLSLRINDLPSNLERTRSHSLEPTDLTRLPNALPPMIPPKPSVSPIPEISPNAQDSVSAMCQQLSRGLTLLSNNDDFTSSINSLSKQLFTPKSPMVTSSNSLDDLKLENGSSINNRINNLNNINSNNNNNISNNNNKNVSISNNNNNELDISSWQETQSAVVSINHRLTPILNTSLSPVVGKSNNTTSTTPIPTQTTIKITDNSRQIGNSPNQVFSSIATATTTISTASTSSLNNSITPIINHSPNKFVDNVSITSNLPSVSGFSSSSNLSNVSNDSKIIDDQDKSKTMGTAVDASTLPKPEQWLGSVTGSVQTPRRVPPPPLHTRALSLGSSAMSAAIRNSTTSDPFDAEWAEIAARNFRQSNNTTNPFIVSNTSQQAFQVQL